MYVCMYVFMYVCMYVCLSVTSLRLKYTGLCIVYVLLACATHDAIARWHGDRGRGLGGQKTGRCQNESRCMKDG